MIGKEDEQSNTACGTNIKQEQMLRQVTVRTKMDMDTQSLTAVIIQIPLIHLRK